tara:strand:+ start:629 stop:730 length:102 start_codon:yes stop_codon:yes gene_type:complete
MRLDNAEPVELGHGYGNGYPLEVFETWMNKISE